MNVRKIMARLNTPTAKLTGGGGGKGAVPSLTPQDIAGALGFVRAKNRLACEVFCRAWWPDGAQLDGGRELRQVFGEQLLAEVTRRDRQLHDAKIELLRAENTRNQRGLAREVRREDADDVTRARSRLEQAQRACWPANAQVVSAVLEAALREVCEPNTCTTCEGSGEVRQGSKVVTCPDCRGHCILPVSDNRRARMLGRNHKTYVDGFWCPMYEFTYSLLRDAEQAGADAMQEQLGSRTSSRAA
jgi:hypothetical protein